MYRRAAVTRPIASRSRTPVSRLIHHPIRGRVVGIVLALVAGGLTLGVVSRAESVTSSYGTTRAVSVARQKLDVGVEITDGDIEIREIPVAVIPQGTADSSVGRTVTETIHPDEPILEARLAPTGVNGPAALIPSGHRGISIPLDVPAPTLATGDRVDLLGGRASAELTRDAVVIDVSEDAVTVAVRDTEVLAVTQALTEGVVVLVLAGAG